MTDPTYQQPEPWEPAGQSGTSATGPATDNDLVWVLRAAKLIVFFIYLVVTACLVVLVLGFVLRLFGASTEADFTEWVYRNVDRIMDPFRGMFPQEEISDRSVVDFSLLFAMIVYGILAVALHAFVSWLAGHIVAVGRRQELARRKQEADRRQQELLRHQQAMARQQQEFTLQQQEAARRAAGGMPPGGTYPPPGPTAP